MHRPRRKLEVRSQNNGSALAPMKTFSKGIVLRSIDYSDSSAVVKVFTHNQGLRSFLIRGVKGKRKKTAYLQPLSLIELEYHLHPRKDLSVAGSVRHLDSYHSIPTHPHKRMVALFLAEVLGETIKSDHVDEPLFDYLHSRLLMFDLEEWYPNFHLLFLAGMTRFLGIFPLLSNHPRCFDIENGAFLAFSSSGPQVVQGEESNLMYLLFTEPWEEAKLIPLSRQARNRLTTHIVTYFQSHAVGMRPLKSLDILTEVLGD